jgi:capsular exopolysaccharide synthesis family protein
MNTKPESPSPWNPFDTIQEEESDFKTYLFNYFKYWQFFLIFPALGFLGAFLVNKWTTPIYNIESAVIVSEGKPSIGDDLFDAVGIKGKSNVENEIGILKSYALAEETISALNLNVSYFENGMIRKTQVYANSPILVVADWTHPQLVGGLFKVTMGSNEKFSIEIEEPGMAVFNPKDPFYLTGLSQLPKFKSSYSSGERIKGDVFDFKIINISSMPGDVLYFSLKDTPSLALQYKNALTVSTFNKQASIISLNLSTPVRRLGEDYLNKLMEMYIDRELKEKNSAAENTILFIDQQLSGITDSLNFFENRLERYRSQNKIFNLSQEGTQIFSRFEELEKEKIAAELNLKYHLTLQSYVTNDQLNDLVAPSITGLADPLLGALVMSLSELQSEKLRLSASFSDQSPVIKEIKIKIENTKKVLQENVKSAISNSQNLINELNRQIRLIEREINTLPETERQLLSIQRQFSINENIYIYLLQKRAEAEITRVSNIPKNSILDNARAGVSPIHPKKQINLLAGLLIGLILPAAFIYLKDLLNTKVKDPKELEKKLHIPLIGLIGRGEPDDSIPVFNSPKSVITEGFRSLRADVNYLTTNKEKITILFTSSISGEGKTYASINMAAVYSLIDKKTIILGLDLRKPRIAEEFGLSNKKGISTCLSSNTPWQSVVQKTAYNNLDVMLSGPIPPNPAELLLQDKFAQMISEIKETYDVVIMDCPPVGLVSETKHLFNYSDVNFFVFRQGFSTKNNIQIANNLVEKGGVTKLYALLNDFHIGSGYGYGYGYGYNSYGYHEEKPMSRWAKIFQRK